MIASCGSVVKAQTVGTGVEIADDKSWAKLRIYLNDGPEIEFSGSPRELRRISRAITEGLRTKKGQR